MLITFKYQKTNYDNYENTMRTIEQLTKDYIDLLAEAEATMNRKDALSIIHTADKVRMEICQMHNQELYPMHTDE